MKVRYDEGLAICIGPEPCVGIREGAGEASVGEHIGVAGRFVQNCTLRAVRIPLAFGMHSERGL